MLRKLSRTILGESRYRQASQALRSLKIILRPKFEPEVSAMPRIVKPGDVVLDIGANYGTYTRVLSRLVGPQGHVYAFEPAAITMQGLQRTCRLLRLRNVSFLRVALTNQSGNATLYTPIKAHGGYGIALAHLEHDARRPSVNETVTTLTLDDFSAQQGLQRLDFIKCDVEGAELAVFQGAVETLQRFHPKIMAEVNQNYLDRHHHSTGELYKFMTHLGYRAFIWDRTALQPVQSIDTPNNYFFLPAAS
jgi:FkbM family methyltransferase